MSPLPQRSTFLVPAKDGVSLFVHRWLPAGPPRGVVQVAHGMSEHAGRYEALAQELNEAGFAVYAQDHRGHGKTAATPDHLGYFGEDTGWSALVNDLGTVQARIADDFPRLPLVLLGHSMGAFLAQQYAGENSGQLSGLVLMGTYREATWLARAGAWLARLERMRLGPRGRSPILGALTFGAFNRRFTPARTPFDWLTRDAQEVDRYIADPQCGETPSIQLWQEVLTALAAGLPLPPPDLPVCVMVGEKDPVCGADPGAHRLARQLRAAQAKVTHHVYPAARHELLHETNRTEVLQDLRSWLGKVV